MALTAYPQPVQKSASAYINAGITYLGGASNINANGTYQLVPFNHPNPNYASGSGYLKVSLTAGVTAVTFSFYVDSVIFLSTYAADWIVEITNPGSTTITWTGIKWSGGVAPTQAAGKRAIYHFYSPDGGTTIYGKQTFASLA